ncbi:quinone oxidoreductase family protein [Microtetraspora niveoalba]|uniref:quinone oxidoreductase family protein n=1 Tax=Microtetraspora niveoalba TaxID=46175 RepID=UPI00082D44B1|nr:zinc-binding alcohol dehydrogenase family protein [Microtetraspora niveoalba]
MRAAVLHAPGETPVVEEFADPEAALGRPVARVLAASLNPVDLAIAGGQMPFRRVTFPAVAGYEGVGETDDGRRWYIAGPALPFGTFAELMPVPIAEALPVPEGVDPALAASLGVAGMAAWLALEYRARLTTGETVLVLGAGGTVGQIAVQAALALGAGRVVGAARGEPSLERIRSIGAHAVARLQEDAAASLRELRDAAPDGYDVIIDLLWGEPVTHAIEAAGRGARLIQVGNSAGPTASLPAPNFRNKLVTIIGHTNFLTPFEARRSAYQHLMEHAAARRIHLELEQILLTDAAQAWEQLKEGHAGKLVIVL